MPKKLSNVCGITFLSSWEPMVNSPLIRPYLLGGVALGGTLDSHDIKCLSRFYSNSMHIPRFGAYLPTFSYIFYTLSNWNYPNINKLNKLFVGQLTIPLKGPLSARHKSQNLRIFFGCLYGRNPCPLACYIPTLPGWQGQSQDFFSFLKWEASHVFLFFGFKNPKSAIKTESS